MQKEKEVENKPVAFIHMDSNRVNTLLRINSGPVALLTKKMAGSDLLF